MKTPSLRRRNPFNGHSELSDAVVAPFRRGGRAQTRAAALRPSAGSGKSKQLVGLDPRLSNVDPVTLRRYVRSAMETVEDPGFVPPEGTVVGAGGTPQATAADIKPALEAFEATLAKIALILARAPRRSRSPPLGPRS